MPRIISKDIKRFFRLYIAGGRLFLKNLFVVSECKKRTFHHLRKEIHNTSKLYILAIVVGLILGSFRLLFDAGVFDFIRYDMLSIAVCGFGIFISAFMVLRDAFVQRCGQVIALNAGLSSLILLLHYLLKSDIQAWSGNQVISVHLSEKLEQITTLLTFALVIVAVGSFALILMQQNWRR